MKIRGWAAVSLDGYVGDAEGGMDWRTPWEGLEASYDAYVSETAHTVVMGRPFHDGIVLRGGARPFPGKREIVVARAPVDGIPPGAEVWKGDVAGLAARLRAEDAGDAWVIGGPALQSAFIQVGELDEIVLFVAPVLLGGGVPLFPRGDHPSSDGRRYLRLLGSSILDRGAMDLRYALR